MRGHWRILSRYLVVVDFQALRHLRNFAAKTLCLVMNAGVPRAECGPGASSNITDFWLCELQNRLRKCCFKKVFTEILTVFLAEIR